MYNVADHRNCRILGFIFLLRFHLSHLAKYLHFMEILWWANVRKEGETSFSSRRLKSGLLCPLTFIYGLNPTYTWMDLLSSGQKARIQRESPSLALHPFMTHQPPPSAAPEPLKTPQLTHSRTPTLRDYCWRSGQALIPVLECLKFFCKIVAFSA